jgi:arylformamidase
MDNDSKIIDISIPLNTSTITYPGNPSISINSQKSSTGQTTISQIGFGSHTGTHIDAPAHVFEPVTIDQIPLPTFIGVARVLDLTGSKEKITKEDLDKKAIKTGERILLRTTNSDKGFESFYEDFVYLDGEAAKYLADLKVILVGIDSLSIKQKGSEDNRPHTELLNKNIPILEGINLKNAPEGTYELICLPLAFTGIDGAPARAILIKK